MNISVKKFSKKSLSLLIALIMVFSALPLTPPISADAATTTTTLNKDSFGMLTNGNDSRFKNKKFNIVNDQGPNNTSAGLLHYDLSPFADTNISTVTFNVTIDSFLDEPNIDYVNFYYSTTINNASTYLSKDGVENANLGWGNGAGNKAVTDYSSNLGFNANQILYLQKFETSKSNVTGSKDVTSIFKNIILSGAKDLYIVIMHNTAGDANNKNHWSDTTITPANINFTVTYSNYDFSNPTQAKDYIDSRINGFVMPLSKAVTCNGTDLNLSNVLYTSNIYLDNSLTEFSLNQNKKDTKMSARLMSPSNRIVYMYTGNKSIVKVPLFFEAQKNSSVLQRYKVNYVCSASSNWTIDNENWIRTTAYNKWDTNSAGTRDGEYKVSSSSTHNAPDFNANNRPEGVDGTTDFRNLVTYNGTLTFSNNYFQISELPKVDMSFDGFCYWYDWGAQYSYQNNITKNTTGLGIALSTISLANTASYSVIDFSGYNALVSNNTMKNKYNDVKTHETEYTEDSVSAYYKAVANLVKFKTSNYDLSKDSGVESCARELATVVSAYNTANNKLTLKTITVQFVNYGGDTVKRVILNPGEAIGEFPANTAPTPDSSFSDKGHNVYYWNTDLTKDSIPTTDVTINELQGTQLIGHSSTTPATCTKKQTCDACGAEYGSYGDHTYNTTVRQEPGPVINGFTYTKCDNCDKRKDGTFSYDDVSSNWTNYNNQLKVCETELSNTAKYTADSIASVRSEVDSIKTTVEGNSGGEYETLSSTFIDRQTDSLMTALTKLEIAKYKVTLRFKDENGVSLNIPGSNVSYQDSQEILYGNMTLAEIPKAFEDNGYSVYKWIRIDGNNDVLSGMNSTSLNVMVKKNMEYWVYLKKTTVDESQANGNAVITLNNKSNKVYDIGYVENNKVVDVNVDVENGTITIGGQKLTAPTYSFYKVKGFKINGNTVDTGTINITGDIVIKPEYEAISSFTITGGNGVVEKSTTTSWDKRVKLTAQTPAQSGKINKWTSTINGQNVVWGYGDTLSFQATQACTVECTEVDVTEFDGAEDVKLSVDYVSYNLYRSNSITAISRVIAPEGIVEEYGTILKTANVKSGATNENYETQKLAVDNKDNYKVTNKSGVFKSTQMISNTNQFAYNFYSAQNYDKMYVGAVAYAKLSDGTYVYSDVVTYEFKR